MINLAKQRNIDVVLMATPTPGIFLSVPEFYRELADELSLVYEHTLLLKLNLNLR
ncbi:MAG: hypothetical protein COB94_010025 [Gammaproteobacteria bacterium]|nr:hypothetical protein [Gammaproteobacteria bacterium]